MSMLKVYVDMITHYDGNSTTLNQYNANCKFLMQTYPTNNISFQNYLVTVIQSKLMDSANLFEGTRSEFNSWPTIKALETCFGDK